MFVRACSPYECIQNQSSQHNLIISSGILEPSQARAGHKSLETIEGVSFPQLVSFQNKNTQASNLQASEP